MPDSFDFRLQIMNEDPLSNGLPNTMTMKQLIELVNKKLLSEELRRAVVAKVSLYPSNSLEMIYKNIDRIIDKTRRDKNL
jgi:hypothetical protein